MYPRFKLDGKGALSSDDAEAQRSFLRRAGNYALLPTSPDLLVLVKTPPEGGAAPTPKVVLAGDASGFPISELIAFLAQSRWTGVVRVVSSMGERTLTLKEGEARAATSEDPTERLGEVMVRLGFLPRKQLDEVLREHPPSKIGRVLVERGALQAHDLYKCMTHQVSEIFHAMVLCHEGTFQLIDQPVDDKQQQTTLLQLSTQSLLMDSIRKVDELAHFRKKIPHGRLHVVRKRASDGKLEPEEDQVLQLVDGNRTVFELAQAARISEFDATKTVFRLLEGGFVQLAERAAPQSAPAAPARGSAKAEQTSGVDARRVVRTFNLIFEQIRAAVAVQSMEKELVAAVNAALQNRALSQSPVLTGLTFDGQGQLSEDGVLRSFDATKSQLGSEPVASLKQALSDVMFFMLFQAGELLEAQADEQLARRVKELLATLEG